MSVLPLRSVGDAATCAAAVAEHLAGGGILAYPTETVYGFGSSLERRALRRLARLKGREGSKSFLLLHADPSTLPGLRWTPAAELLAARRWPGPLSLALAADDRYAAPVRAPGGTVAVRDTPHAALRALLRHLAVPLTSTSANLAGGPPATSLSELQTVIAAVPGGDRILVLDGGALPASLPSTVVDCSGEQPRLLRAGAVPLAELRTILAERGWTIDVG
jgi:L-threonylcarbamoyladenylate synthase